MKKSVTVPTLQTIAELAGVTRATVSLALRNKPAIPERTRERIQKIAQQVGYQPNPKITALMTQVRATRTEEDQGTLAFLTNFPTRDGWTKMRTYQRFFNGAAERAKWAGYRLEEFWLKERGMTSPRMNKILYSRGISGVLISPVLGTGHLSLNMTNLASVTFGLSLQLPDIHRVDNNQIDTVRKALRELKRRGYRRIGLAFQSWEDRHVNHAWSAGYLEYTQRGVLASNIPIYKPRSPFKETCLAWIAHSRLDAVLTVSSMTYEILREDIDVPGTLGYAVLDWRETDQRIAGIDQRPELSGSAAVDMLLGQIYRSERGIPPAAKLLLTQGVWVEGESVRPFRPRIQTSMDQPDPERVSLSYPVCGHGCVAITPGRQNLCTRRSAPS